MAEKSQVEQELDEVEENLQRLADKWRARLQELGVQEQVKAGRLRLSPLVVELLEAFPPREQSPPPPKK